MADHCSSVANFWHAGFCFSKRSVAWLRSRRRCRSARTLAMVAAWDWRSSARRTPKLLQSSLGLARNRLHLRCFDPELERWSTTSKQRASIPEQTIGAVASDAQRGSLGPEAAPSCRSRHLETDNRELCRPPRSRPCCRASCRALAS